ncbi:MAG: lactonase family protein [Chloroflexi bacterium]|nr:lactonase family protein [Chloroflexota bacterium]
MADWLMFVGTYTRGGGSKGIYVFRMDGESGAMTQVHVEEGISNPSFLAVHPSQKYLYAVNEVAESSGVPGGALTAYAIDASSGKLERINQQSTGGAGPCHVAIDATGKYAVVANYSGGSVCMLPISEDGSLKPSSHFVQHYGGTKVNPRRQEKAHAHSANLSPDNRFAIINDLGLDQLRVYEMDLGAGKLIFKESSSVKTVPGAGPRHFDFHPNGRFAYVINELGCTVAAYRYNAATAAMTMTNALSTLPKGYKGENTTADIHVSPNGRFVYGSNRGHNTLAIFRINQSDGSIEFVGDQSTGGKTPRNFAIHPDGKYLYAANQDSDSIIQFEVNQSTGELMPVGREIRCPMPVCLKLMPLG